MNTIKNKTIIVIEDDSDIAELIKFILDSQGFQVTIFADGRSIMNRIKEINPNLIIVDLWIPGVDGATLTKKLKKEKSTKKIPIILVSANNSLEQITKQTKADGCLAKPFNIKDLLTIVKKFIK